MRPAGPRVGVGQRVIATVTISPGCAPLVSVGWTWMSTRILLVERDDVAEARAVEDVAADHLGRGALEHLDDAALGARRRSAAVVAAPAVALAAALGQPGHALEADDAAVALHRLLEVDAGDVDVAADAFDGALGPDEAEALGAHVNPPTTRCMRSGRPKWPPRVAMTEPDATRCLRRRRNAGRSSRAILEPLGELRQGGGMVDLLADAGQDSGRREHWVKCSLQNLYS